MASGILPIPTDMPIKYLGTFGNANSQRAATITLPRGKFYILFVASAVATKNLVAFITSTSTGVTNYDVIHQDNDSVLTISTDTDTVKITTPNNQNVMSVLVIPMGVHSEIPTMSASSS